MDSLLAWITWNPSREAFTVPLIDRPVTWYGILFASGFAICYLLLIYIFKIQIWRTGKISKLWVKNWPKFISELKTSPLQSHVSSPVSKDNKDEIVNNLNQLITNPQIAPTRKAGMQLLHKKFPTSFMSAYDVSFYLIDRLLWYAILGTLIGARLGHVLFYELARYLQNPLEIFMVWNGGLASHGAAIGLLLATYLFYVRYRDSLPGSSYFLFLDLFTIPVPIAGACIRLGNFINQEILGTPTTLPWAIIFGNPADGSAVLPRHPVMLYEAAAYLLIFGLSYTLWKYRGSKFGPGFFSGLFFTLVFSARFIMEFLKVAQTDVVVIPGMRMGQLLSIPFIILGLLLIWRSYLVASPAWHSKEYHP